MPTEVLHVDATWPDPGALRRAADVLRGGGLVAFPTETVYGLGAHALDAAAVEKIFAAKDRPANNPLIVHVAGVAAARELAAAWPPNAQLLAERFWPGALTLVLPRGERVPDIVTAGGPTVALRVPSHPVALALLETCRLPLAAPSANRSQGLSPTRGDHVLRSLEGRFELLLDAGATPGGLESTVLDLTCTPPRLLRPGLVSVAAIEAVLGCAVTKPVLISLREMKSPHAEREEYIANGSSPLKEQGVLPSPGMMPRHYAPRTVLEIAAGTGVERIGELCRQGLRVGWITLGEPDCVPSGAVHQTLPDDPAGYAARFYAALHDMDEENLDRIVMAAPPDTDAWLAIRDRLMRASATGDG